MSETINLFDLAFLGFTILFVITGFFRGFIREIASLLIWIVSAAATYFLAPYAADLLLKYSDSKVAAYVSSRILIFIFIFFTLSLAISDYVKDLKEKIPSSFNRSFGVLFGVFKSVLIFSLIYAAVVNVNAIVISKSHQQRDQIFTNRFDHTHYLRATRWQLIIYNNELKELVRKISHKGTINSLNYYKKEILNFIYQIILN